MSTAASSGRPASSESVAPSVHPPASAPTQAPPAPPLGIAGVVRITWKIPVILLGTAVLASGLAVSWIPSVVAGSRGPRWRASCRQFAFRLWGTGMLKTLGVRTSVEGRPPAPGRLIVSNHLGYIDIATLASLLPAVFVSKAEVRSWPFWGAMASMAGTIFIDRGKKRDTVRVLQEMDGAFARGDSVVVFPEATSTDGSTIWPFKSSLLAAAAAAGNPVEWMTVGYDTPDREGSARLQICWWGDMGFLRHFLGLCALRRIEARIAFGDQPQIHSDRKALAQTLRGLMLTQHIPVT